MKCFRCGLPMLGGVLGLSALHCRCFTHYAPAPNAAPQPDGCHPFTRLTEADVRRIVRDELAKASNPTPKE